MSTLVLVRHGQSQWNLENRFTGWVDVPLTDAGRREAERAGELLAETGLRFTNAYTSDLIRAQDTLSIILDRIGQADIPVTRDQALNERHYGDLQGLNKEETAKKFGEEQVLLWRRSYDVAPPGDDGESLKDTAARTLPFFNTYVRADLEAGRTVLVSAHGNSLRSIVMDLDGLTAEQVVGLNIATGVPIIYEFDEDGKVSSKKILEA